MHARTTSVMVLVITAGFHSTGFAQAKPPRALWAIDSLAKVLRSATPGPDAGGPVRMSGSRGEIVSGQAVFRSAVDLTGTTASLDGLRHRVSDAIIPPNVVKLQWLRYIDVNRNTDGAPDDELVAKAPTSIPDPYWEDAIIPIKAQQAQPVWIEVHIPRRVAAGDYDGNLVVAGGGETVALPVTLHVWDFEMPAARHVSVINWGRFPGQAYAARAQKGSEQYFKLFGTYCAFLVAHRQTDVLGSIGWIEQKGSKEPGYTYDTGRLERYAEAAFAAGIQQMHIHTAGRKTGPILDPKSRVEVERDGNGPQFSRLKALEQLIQRRGWQGRFLVSITDEPFIHHEESFAAAADLIHQTAPSVRIIEAVEAEYLGKLDIYVPKLSHLNLWYPRFDEIRRESLLHDRVQPGVCGQVVGSCGASEWSGWTRSYSSDFLAYRNHAGLYADFHSCRHLFITSLERAGIRPKMAQTLARHSDIRLTMNVYTHVELHDQTAAIEALPGPPGGGREGGGVRSAGVA